MLNFVERSWRKDCSQVSSGCFLGLRTHFFQFSILGFGFAFPQHPRASCGGLAWPPFFPTSHRSLSFAACCITSWKPLFLICCSFFKLFWTRGKSGLRGNRSSRPLGFNAFHLFWNFLQPAFFQILFLFLPPYPLSSSSRNTICSGCYFYAVCL